MRLHEASENGDEKAVHRLFKDGVDVSAKDGYDEMRRRYSVHPVADTRRW